MSVVANRRRLTAFATLVFFTALASDAWRDSIGWYGYGAVVAIVLGGSIALLVRHRRLLSFRTLPAPLVAFLSLATLSIAWSFYPGASALGVLAQIVTTIPAVALALALTADELVASLGRCLRIVLSLSLLFELVVSLIVRAPVFPVWVTAAQRVHPPELLYWSRNLLLAGDKIQGIVGSSSLLAMAALLGLIVFAMQWAAGTVSRLSSVLGIVLSVACVALTRSATIFLGLAAVAIVLAMIVLLRRAVTARARRITLGAIIVGCFAAIVVTVVLRTPILAVLGKSDNLTGRSGIWEKVIALAQERPIAGWGWVSFWAPWVEPFKHLVTRNGVVQLHAHNAWLDVWLQLGILGLVVFGLLVAGAAVRSWWLATDPDSPGAPHAIPDARRRRAYAVLPALLITALLVQTLAESRILIEGGWVLLVLLATVTKRQLRARDRAEPRLLGRNE